MTRFLSADGIREDLRALSAAVDDLEGCLRQLRADAELPAEQWDKPERLTSLMRGYLYSVSSLLDAFPCAPLIYTGASSTEDVIGMLERLLARADNDE